ncbi:MAG: serine protease [Alistipes sp.]|nr:serine protease [Alistipes sp.]
MKKLIFIFLLLVSFGVYGQESNENQWSGSAIVIGDYHLVTNYHVVDGAKSLTISGSQGDYKTSLKTKVVAVDKTNDLAIIKVVEPSFNGFDKPCYGINTSSVDVGTNVFVLGYPLTSTMGSEVKLTTGVISSKTGFQGDPSIYQISAPIQPGNSGGPLLDNSGNLIGIVCAKHKGAEQVGYAIKLIYLQILIESCGESIPFNNSNTIANLSFTEKIKRISPYVYMVKAFSANDKTAKIEKNEIPNTTDILESKKLFDAAAKFYQQKQDNEAFIAIDKSVLLNPNTENHYLRAYCAMRVRNFTSVVESASYCIDRGHQSLRCYTLLGRAYYLLKNFDASIKSYDNAILLDRQNINALYWRGRCKQNLGNPHGAISDFKTAVQYDGIVAYKGYYRIYNEIAWQLFLLNNFEEAKKYAEIAVNKNPFYGNSWDTYGAILYKLADYSTSVKKLNTAISCVTDTGNHWLKSSYYYRGLSNIQLGNEADALEDFQKAKTLGCSDVDSLIVKLSTNNNGKSVKFLNIYREPQIGSTNIRQLTIRAIESSNEYTTIHFSLVANGEYWLDKNTHIIDVASGEKLPLIKTDKITVGPARTKAQGEFLFSATFPAIGKDCAYIHFSEGESGWQLKFICLQCKEQNNENKDTLIDTPSDGTNSFISWKDVIVVEDMSATKGLVAVGEISKTSLWGGDLGQNLATREAIKKIKKEAAMKGCCMAVITNIEYPLGATKITAMLYRRPNN